MGRDPLRVRVVEAGRAGVDEKVLIAWCREHIAHFKAPKSIVFRELPKTATGKIQKYKLRQEADALGSLS